MHKHALKEFDTKKDRFTKTQLEQLLNRYNWEPADLVDESSTYYRENYADTSLDREDLMNVIQNHPEVIKTPIAMYRDKAFFQNSAYDFIKEEMEFNGINPKHANKDEV